MSGILLGSDFHFGASQFSKKLFHKKIEYFQKIVFPYIIENDIKSVLQLGDLVDSRIYMDNYILSKLNTDFFDFFIKNDIKFYGLIGNHDIFYKNTRYPNIQDSLFKHKNLISIAEEDIIEVEGINFHMVPWIIEKNDFHNYSNKVDIVCGHFEFNGFIMEGNVLSRKGFDAKMVDGYKHVFSGHYHSRSTNDHIQYLGSPFQLKWSQYLTKTGIYHLTRQGSQYDVKFIENTFSPKYLKVYYIEDKESVRVEIFGTKFDSSKYVNDILHNDILEIVKNNMIKVVIKQYTNSNILEGFLKELQNTIRFGKLEIINEFDFININDPNQLADIGADIEIPHLITKRLNELKLPVNIDPEKVNSYLQTLYKEASEKNDQI